MRGVVLLAGLGGLGYWAYRQGYLPQAAPLVDAVSGGISDLLDQTQWGRGDEVRAEQSAAMREAMGGQVVPVLGAGEVIERPAHESMLRRNWSEVSGWARANIGWAAAICAVENRPMNPALVGDNGHAFGVLQVHVPTAETCYRSGYTRYQPTAATLQTLAGGIYFGTAEMERLGRMGKGLDWTICAYNGGAGWEQMSADYQQDRREYLSRVKAAFVGMYGKGEAV